MGAGGLGHNALREVENCLMRHFNICTAHMGEAW